MLQKIIKYKKDELKQIKAARPLTQLKTQIRSGEGTRRDFAAALQRTAKESQKVSIIGEIKKASPSQGVIREDFDPSIIADIYNNNGISAISVLTDRHFFQGDSTYLSVVKKRVSVPVLRKDFIFDEYQVYESVGYDADAILLIAAILERNQFSDLLDLALELTLQVLVEIHNEKDLEKIYPAIDRCSVIGINNRDLETFTVDTATTIRLCKELPKGKTVVSESGIKDKTTIISLMEEGVDAFLIGESFMREQNIAKKVKEFVDLN